MVSDEYMHYLELDDLGTYINIYCDGYYMEFLRGSGNELGKIYESSGNTITLDASLNDSSETFTMGQNLSRITTVLDDSNPAYKTIEVAGNMYSSLGNWLGGSETAITFTYRFTFYADRFTCSCKAACGGSPITIANSTENRLFDIQNVTNPNYVIYAESSGVETAVSPGPYNSANYFVILADITNFQGINIYNDGISSVRQYASPPDYMFTWNDATFAANTAYEMVCEFIVDSVGRDYGSQKYVASDRLLQGIQYKNVDTLTYNEGAPVTAGTGTTSIGTKGFNASGVYQMRGGITSYTLGQTEYNPVTIQEGFSFTSGDPLSPTEYKNFTWDCEGVAASNYYKKEGTLTVNNATYEDNGLKCDAYYEYGKLAGITSTTLPSRGCILFQYRRTQATFSSNYPRIFDLGTTGTTKNFTFFRTITSELNFNIGNVAGTLGSDELLYDFNKHNVILCWGENIRRLYIDNLFIGEVTTSYTMPTITGNDLFIGNIADGTNPSEGIIYDFKIFDEWIDPYGAYFTTNTTDTTDYSLHHKDILSYYAGSDNTAVNIPIGSVQCTKGGSGGTFYTSSGLGKNGHYFDTEGTAYLTFPVTSQDIITFSLLSIGIWFTVKTIGGYLFGVGDANDYFQCSMDASGNLDPVYRSASTSTVITGDIPCAVDGNHFLQIKVDDTDKIQSFIDGVENGTAQTIANVWDGIVSGLLYLGADYGGNNIADIFIHEIYITSNSNSPQIPTVNSVPLHIPVMEQI